MGQAESQEPKGRMTLKLAFKHLRNTENTGDRYCCPYDYFDWPDASVEDIRNKSDDYTVGVYGGGKIFGGLSEYEGVIQSPGSTHIAWGVGTLQRFLISRRYSRARRLMDLVGSRDYGDRHFPWVPCVSCMSEGFDDPSAPEHDVVFYYHGGKTDSQGITIPDDMPRLGNDRGNLDEALSFIASGRTVVSNSYHGVYWGLLMKRRVLCIPFSYKFSAFRKPPAYAKPQDWLNKLDTAVAHPDLLSLCRDRTLEFKAEVDAVIAKRAQA